MNIIIFYYDIFYTIINIGVFIEYKKNPNYLRKKEYNSIYRDRSLVRLIIIVTKNFSYAIINIVIFGFNRRLRDDKLSF